MACDNFTYTPRGRRGLGLNQPQSGLDYPLVSASDDIAGLLADFYFAYEGTNTNVKHPIKIKWLYGVGCNVVAPPAETPTPQNEADIVLVDANGVVVFDSTAATVNDQINQFSSWCWGLNRNLPGCPPTHDYKIYEWINGRSVCRIVVYQTWPPSGADSDDDGAKHYDNNILPAVATVDERAVYKIPKRVTSIILPAYNQKITNTAVNFVAGFNTELAVEAEQTRGVRRTNYITINAEPGAGLGKYSDCIETAFPIRSLNGVAGPNVTISGNECIALKIPTAHNTTTNKLTPQRTNNHATYQIYSNCPACCTCDDYVDLALYMNSTRDLYKAIGADTNQVLLTHSDNIARWLAQKECRLQKPIKICMTPQRCPFIDVIVQLCNNGEECLENSELNINFDTFPANTATTVCGYTTLSTARTPGLVYALNGAWPNFTANLGNVDAGNSASVKFRLEFANAAPTIITATATGASSAGPVVVEGEPTTAALTRALYCDETGGTTPLC
jgi:hypothetical protein